MRVVLVTGGFDPIHSGHIAYFKAAKQLGDRLVIGLNSDSWLVRKKGQAFMPFSERVCIVENIGCVDHVTDFHDADGSARDAIVQVRKMYPEATIVFANGGDRTQANIPEMDVQDPNLEFRFGVGGEDKKNSSSWILQEWKAPKTQRPWGYYRVLHEVPGMKVKELTVDPGKSLSMQKHNHRAEYWIVSEGRCVVNSVLDSGYQMPPVMLGRHQDLDIATGDWHQLTNPYDTPCRVVEIQYGEVCEESDIIRKDVQPGYGE
jgi:cytidyltransferase-like protein